MLYSARSPHLLQLSQRAREIYNSFLSSKATTPVNIDSQAQLADDILNAPRPDMFKEQQLQVAHSPTRQAVWISACSSSLSQTPASPQHAFFTSTTPLRLPSSIRDVRLSVNVRVERAEMNRNAALISRVSLDVPSLIRVTRLEGYS